MLRIFEERAIEAVEVGWTARRRAELLAELRQLDAQQMDLDGRARAFRSQHCALLGGVMTFMVQDAAERAALDSQWRSMLAERDQITRRRNSLLEELASLKEARSTGASPEDRPRP